MPWDLEVNDRQTVQYITYNLSLINKTNPIGSCDIYSINTVAIAPFQHTEKTGLKGAQNMN